MKVTPEHLQQMQATIKPLDTETRRNLYRSRQFSRAEHTKDLDKRYRWDLYWQLPSTLRDALYVYLGDTHIETALKHLIKPL